MTITIWDAQVCVSLFKAGVGAGIGAVLSAKDIYEVGAPRTTQNNGLLFITKWLIGGSVIFWSLFQLQKK